MGARTRLWAMVVAALVSGAACSDTPMADAPREATGIELVSGDQQQGMEGQALRDALTVRVFAADGLGVEGVDVTFSATGGGGRVDEATVTSGPDGVAATGGVFGDASGDQTFEASVAALGTVEFTMTGYPYVGLRPISGYVAELVAEETGTTATFGGLLVRGLTYNPDTDYFLTINRQGFDDIVEITRAGEFRTIVSGFGGGGTKDDHFSVGSGNFGWVAEGHGRTLTPFTPATEGGVRAPDLVVPDDPNGGSPELHASEPDANGDLIVGFGPSEGVAEVGVPRDWYRVTQAGVITPLFTSSNSVIFWMTRDPSTDRFYGFDLYDSGSSAGWSTANSQLVEIDIAAGSIEPVGSELDGDFVDLSFDYSRDLVDRDVIWAIRNTFSVEEVNPADGTNPDGDFVVALSDNALRGLAIAPSTSDSGTTSMYVLVLETVGDDVTARLVEVRRW
ncbi:MAG: hypothetical protein AAF389_19890 [Gemmatimonadota bacterium]